MSRLHFKDFKGVIILFCGHQTLSIVPSRVFLYILIHVWRGSLTVAVNTGANFFLGFLGARAPTIVLLLVEYCILLTLEQACLPEMTFICN